MSKGDDYLVPKEEEEQKTIAQWLDTVGLCWCHIPNEGRHKVQYRAKMKRLGLKSGVPDILIFDHPPLQQDKVGTAIELKRRNRSASRVKPSQKEWLNNLDERMWIVAVCYGADEAIKLLTKLGYTIRNQCKTSDKHH